MCPLRLLQLPYLAQKAILSQMRLVEVIWLSLVSSKIKRILEWTKFPIESLEVSILKNSTNILLGLGRERLFISAEPHFNDVWLNRKFNEEVFRMSRVRNEWDQRFYMRVHLENTGLVDELQNKIVRHLLSFLRVESINLRVDHNLDFGSMFIFNYTNSLKKMRIASIWPYRIPSEQVEFLLENFRSESLELQVDLPNKYKFRDQFNHKKIRICNSSWIDFNQISIAPNVKHAEFRDVKISNRAINQHFKKSIQGEYEELECLVFYLSAVTSNKNLVLKGLKAVESTNEQIYEFAVSPRMRFKADRQLDVKRITDGQVATICFYRNCVGLFVSELKEVRDN